MRERSDGDFSARSWASAADDSRVGRFAARSSLSVSAIVWITAMAAASSPIANTLTAGPEGRPEDETEGKRQEHEQHRERVPEEGGSGQRDQHEEHDEEQCEPGAHGSSDPSALSNAASSRAGSLHPGSSSAGGRISRRRCSSCTLS